MSKNDIDLDYAIPGIDISREELNEIIAETDRIITENSESNEKLAIACLKKVQCLQKLDEYDENTGTQREKKGNITNTQELIKNLIEKALELHPNMPEALMQMGKMYHKLSVSEEKSKEGNMEKAIDMYCKAIQLKPDYAAAYNNKGLIYYDKNEYDMAIKDYTEAIRLNPNNYVPYYNRGNVFFEKDKYDLAIRDYSTAIRINPKCALARNNLDDAYAKKAGFTTIDLKKANILEPENEFVKALNHIQNDVIPNIEHGEPILECSFCGLPIDLTYGLMGLDDHRGICSKCINNSEILEKIKLDNETYYNEIIKEKLDPMIGLIENKYDEIYEGYTKWLTNLSIDELRIRAKEYVKPRPPEPIIINNTPMHKNQSAKLLEGEIFKKQSEKDVDVSNLGRVKQGDCILEQYDPHNDGYLFVDIKSTEKTISEKVYRLVAETWLERPDLKELPEVRKSELHNTVHHISNNGYDNRMENLMWVTEWQHAMIHPRIRIDKFDFEELILLFESYRYINIKPLDYQRIISITKRIKQLDRSETPEENYSNYENIIEAMEDLIKKNAEDKKDSL